jgi:hypothetical protein
VPQAAQVCLLFLGQHGVKVVAALDAVRHLPDKPLRVRSDAEDAAAKMTDHDGEGFILPNQRRHRTRCPLRVVTHSILLGGHLAGAPSR